MSYIEANDLNFEEIVKNSDIPVIVDFWAPWCGPCRMLAPIFEKLAKDYEWKVKFVKVNVDENPKTAIEYMVQWIPTVMIFKNWKPVKTLVWVKPENEYKQELDNLLWEKDENNNQEKTKENNTEWEVLNIYWGDEFEEALNKYSDKLIIADFWAPWCWPCKMLAPTLEQIAKDYSDKVKVIKINVDEPVNQDLAMQFQVQSIPTIAFIQKDKPIEIAVWALPYETFKDIIEKKTSK